MYNEVRMPNLFQIKSRGIMIFFTCIDLNFPHYNFLNIVRRNSIEQEKRKNQKKEMHSGIVNRGCYLCL